MVRPGLSSKRPDDFFLPDFCAPRIVLAVVLVSELLALTFSLVRHTDLGFFVELGRISILMQWLGLTSAALLCLLRTPLQRRSTLGVTSVVVTHDLHSALAIATRIAMLHHGKIIELASPEEFVKSKNEVVRSFLDAQYITKTGFWEKEAKS